MSQYVEGPVKSFAASGPLGDNLRVRNPASVALAGALDASIGTVETPVFSSLEPVAVRLRNAQGTRKMVANGAIPVGPVYAAAAGKISATGTVLEGFALEAATGDGDVIEVLMTDTAAGALMGPVVQSVRTRFTAAQINAGATLLAAVPGLKYRVIDASFIAIGGNASGATTVDLLATQSASSVRLVANAVAGLTQNTLLRAGATNSTILGAGASFVQNDANTALTVGKTGSDLATATHVDVLVTFELSA